MEDVEITIDADEEAEAPAEAVEEPSEESEAEAAPEAEEEPTARRETAPEPTYDPTHYYRQRVQARQQRAEQQRLAEIQRRMEELGKPKSEEGKPAAPQVPDREKDPEGWALHQMREAARTAMREELAPLLAGREQQQQQQFTQQTLTAQQQERMQEIAHLATVQEQHYPGYRERLKAWSEGMVSIGVQEGKPVQVAQQEVAQYIQTMAQLSESRGKNPVHELDVLMSMQLGAWGWKPESQRKAKESAAQEVEETKRALASPAAKTMTGASRAGSTRGKVTGAALVKVARANGGKVERGQLVAAAKSRMAETNGDFSEAMDLVMREVATAERRSA